jgi:hypothetical protein
VAPAGRFDDSARVGIDCRKLNQTLNENTLPKLVEAL